MKSKGAIVDGVFDPTAPLEVEYRIDKRGRAYEVDEAGTLRRVKDPVEEMRIVKEFKKQETEAALQKYMVEQIQKPEPPKIVTEG